MDEKFFGKKKRGGRDPALTVTGNGGGPASLDFATWTDASALPIDRRSQSVSIMPAWYTSSINCECLDYFNNKDLSQPKCPYVFIPASERIFFDWIETKWSLFLNLFVFLPSKIEQFASIKFD